MDKITVIVPIYKVEQWMDACIKSIVEQTYENLEIILVDDGSPDRCPVLCDEWAKKDARIQVIHKRNGGLSDARNAGIDIATGEWITFVDSDDWIHCQALEWMLKLAKSNNVKLVMARYQRVPENEQIIDGEIEKPSVEKMNRNEALMSLYWGENTQTVAWGKLYHRSLWTDLRYPLGRIHEDEFITYKLMYYAEKIVYMKDVLYYYRIRNDSIITSGKEVVRRDLIDALWERQDFFEENGIYELLSVNKTAAMDLTIERAMACAKNKDKMELREMHNCLKKAKAVDLSLKMRIKRSLCMLSPGLLGGGLCLLRKIRGKQL